MNIHLSRGTYQQKIFRGKHPLIVSSSLLLLLFVNLASAQSVAIDWWKIAGGGGTSSNGSLSVSGTLGQHEAGGPLSDGHVSVSGGFWSLYAVQVPGAPVLSTARTTTNTVAVFWPSSSTGWLLQQNTNSVSSLNWSNVTATILDDGTTKTLIVNPPTGKRFFRLCKPAP